MSLAYEAGLARAHADTCLDPGCHAAANALEGALDAEAREQLTEMAPDRSTEGIPTPEESGYPAEMWIERGEN